MSAGPKTRHDLVVRDICGFLFVGLLLLLVYVLLQDEITRMAKGFSAKPAAATRLDIPHAPATQSADSATASRGNDVPEPAAEEKPAIETLVGWKQLNDPRLPAILHVPGNTAFATEQDQEFLGLPVQALQFEGSAAISPGSEMLLKIRWVRTKLDHERRQRILRWEPSRLFQELGLKPRVGLSNGESTAESDRDLLTITTQLMDGRTAVARYFLDDRGVLEIVCIAPGVSVNSPWVREPLRAPAWRPR